LAFAFVNAFNSIYFITNSLTTQHDALLLCCSDQWPWGRARHGVLYAWGRQPHQIRFQQSAPYHGPAVHCTALNHGPDSQRACLPFFGAAPHSPYKSYTAVAQSLVSSIICA